MALEELRSRVRNQKFCQLTLLSLWTHLFGIPILFEIIQISYNKVFVVKIKPQSLGARVVSYILGGFKVFMEWMVVQTLEETHLVANWSFSSLLRVKSNGGQLAPPDYSDFRQKNMIEIVRLQLSSK